MVGCKSVRFYCANWCGKKASSKGIQKKMLADITRLRYIYYEYSCMCGFTQRLHGIFWRSVEGVKIAGNLRYLILNADSS